MCLATVGNASLIDPGVGRRMDVVAIMLMRSQLSRRSWAPSWELAELPLPPLPLPLSPHRVWILSLPSPVYSSFPPRSAGIISCTAQSFLLLSSHSPSLPQSPLQSWRTRLAWPDGNHCSKSKFLVTVRQWMQRRVHSYHNSTLGFYNIICSLNASQIPYYYLYFIGVLTRASFGI